MGLLAHDSRLGEKYYGKTSQRTFIAVKKWKTLLLCLCIFAISAGCLSASPLSPSPASSWASSEDLIPYVYTSRRPPIDPKHYTIMVYLNGSDLETDHKAATIDLLEMVESGFDQEHLNLIVFTGGTRNWHLDFIPNKKNAIFELDNGGMTRLASVGKSPMGDPAVLAGFVNFCKTYYPAEHYGLIFWNHGGGAIQGFGHDERYEDNPERAMMKLKDIDRALHASQPANGFEFLGFDTCLMATLELAGIAGKYARYLIASQELEPVDGWDYAFLGHIQPGSTGVDIGVDIIRYYEAFYQDCDLGDLLTLSLVDLEQIGAVYLAFENLARGTGYALSNGAFSKIAKARANTRCFGSEEGDGPDMVDLAQLAQNLQPVSPYEAKALEQALSEAVIYEFNNYPGELGGLSIYFPFANKRDLEHSLAIFKEMNQLPHYTRLLSRFAHKLASPPDENAETALTHLSAWTSPQALGLDAPEDYLIKLFGGSTETQSSPLRLNGHPVSAYEITKNQNQSRYAIPVRLNEKDASLLVLFREGEQPHILGAVPTGDDAFNRMDKKVVPLRPGDCITPLYPALPITAIAEIPPENPAQTLWLPGERFFIEDSPTLEQTPEQAPTLHYFWELTDVQGNHRYVEI